MPSGGASSTADHRGPAPGPGRRVPCSTRALDQRWGGSGRGAPGGWFGGESPATVARTCAQQQQVVLEPDRSPTSLRRRWRRLNEVCRRSRWNCRTRARAGRRGVRAPAAVAVHTLCDPHREKVHPPCHGRSALLFRNAGPFALGRLAEIGAAELAPSRHRPWVDPRSGAARQGRRGGAELFSSNRKYRGSQLEATAAGACVRGASDGRAGGGTVGPCPARSPPSPYRSLCPLIAPGVLPCPAGGTGTGAGRDRGPLRRRRSERRDRPWRRGGERGPGSGPRTRIGNNAVGWGRASCSARTCTVGAQCQPRPIA